MKIIEKTLVKKNKKKEKDKDASTHIDAPYSEGAKKNVLWNLFLLFVFGLSSLSLKLGSICL